MAATTATPPLTLTPAPLLLVPPRRRRRAASDLHIDAAAQHPASQWRPEEQIWVLKGAEKMTSKSRFQETASTKLGAVCIVNAASEKDMVVFASGMIQATLGKMKAHLSLEYNGRDTLSYTQRPLDQLHSSSPVSPTLVVPLMAGSWSPASTFTCISWRPCSAAISTCASWPRSSKKVTELATMKKATRELTMLLTPTGAWSTVILCSRSGKRGCAENLVARLENGTMIIGDLICST